MQRGRKEYGQSTLRGRYHLPMMQCLDEEYLDVDAQFGGVDQRKIFALSHDVDPRIGWKPRAHLMNPMIPSLAAGSSGKMSSSDAKSKIDLLDTDAAINKKVRKAFCTPQVTTDNGVLAFIRHVVLPYSALQSPDGTPSVSIRRKDPAETVTFNAYEKLVAAYEADEVRPQDTKEVVRDNLTRLIGPI